MNRTLARSLAACLLLAPALVGCEEGPSGVGSGRGYADEDAGTCMTAAAGCPCEAGEGPESCYLEPVTNAEGHMVCTAGQRYCRDGRWTGCEGLTSYILSTGSALIEGPSACNACDPACAFSSDTPGPADLTPANSTGVIYDPGRMGVTLPSNGTTVLPLPDTDGDGVPDDYDLFPGDGTRDGFTENGGLFHELLFNDTAGPDPITLSTALSTADIYFLIDRTGSMAGEIANLQSALTMGTIRPGCTGGVIGAIRCIIPDAWFGVGYIGEFPVSPYGDSNDVPYMNLQNITGDTVAAQTAINGLTTNGNIDWYEALGTGLYSTVTGIGYGSWIPNAPACPNPGEWGYPCFRPGSIPIIIAITDAPFHNGPNSAYDYDPADFANYQLPPAPYVTGNDTLAGAHDLGDITGMWVGATGNTGGYGNDLDFGCNSNSADTIFRFTLTASQTVTITTQGSGFNTVLGVFDVPTLTGFCNDDYAGTHSTIVQTLAPGDYYVVVDGNSAAGSYHVAIGDPCASGNCGGPPSWTDTVNALRARNVRTIGVESSEGYLDALTNLEDLGVATGSVDGVGSPFVFSIAGDGSGVSNAVVDAVDELANYQRMDITAQGVDNPATAGFDETTFIETLTAVSFPAGRCAGISGTDTFLQCLPGTSVNFAVTFRNDVVMPTATAQVFDFEIRVIGDGTVNLDTIPVRIVVPPERPTYPPAGSYWRDYDSTLYCQSNERPDWGALNWSLATPPGTSVTFEIRVSDDLPTIASRTPVTFTVPPATPPQDVGALLDTALVPRGQPYMRVTAVLNTSSDMVSVPTLYSFDLTYTCRPVE